MRCSSYFIRVLVLLAFSVDSREPGHGGFTTHDGGFYGGHSDVR
jgi:hypothetical protein